MGKVDVLKETTPLSSEDCFLVMQRPKSGFNFPLHVHMEFVISFLLYNHLCKAQPDDPEC